MTDRSKNKTSNRKGDFIYGLHAVKAALANPKRNCRMLWLSENAARRLETDLAAPHLTKLERARATPAQISKLCGGDAVHQGALLEADPLPEITFEDLGTDFRLILVLDQLSDPHNVGAILRSAAAFNADAILMTRRHGPPTTPVLTKAASGAIEYVPLIRVGNLARALEKLGELGVTRIGLDGAAEQNLEDVKFTPPLALILGAEGKGLRRLTSEACDHLTKLTMPGPIKSLNVSNAAALALQIVTRGDKI